MGYVADRWHKSKPAPGEPECGEHKGKVASSTHGIGKRWQARYDGPDGRERTSVHGTKTGAEAEVVKQESAKQRGSWLDPKAGAVTVERFAVDTWLPAQNIIGRTITEYRGALRRYLIPELGNRQMRSIRPSEAGAWQNLLTVKYELGGSYPNRVARYARSVFRLAVTDRVIAVSPFDGIKAPILVPAVVDPPDIAEVLDLVAAAYKPLWQTMFELAALTGLRSGELRAMRVQDLDTLRRLYRVEQQLVYEPGEGLFFDKLKTGAGRRVLPLNQRAIDLLAAYIAKHPAPAAGRWEGLIFTMPGGQPIGESTIDWALKATCGKASARPRHMHELRHHYASVLIAGGENPKVVQKRLGHKNVLTTMTVYAHLWAEAEEQTRDVLDTAWAKHAPSDSSARGGRIPESQSGDKPLAKVSAISG
jgi:integrase